MGLLTWWRTAWGASDALATAADIETVIAASATESLPTLEPALEPTHDTLLFNGHVWTRDESKDLPDSATVTFTREVAVRGRAAVNEIRVHAADLESVGVRRFTLRGRS